MMVRVNKQRPCPVCGKADWCLVSENGASAICPRVTDGAVKKCGDAGWLHVIDERPCKRTGRPKSWRVSINAQNTKKDFGGLSRGYIKSVTKAQLQELSKALSISDRSLKRLCVGWDGKAYTFPMRSAAGDVIGIRRRFLNGGKCSYKGSRNGLFIPEMLSGDGPLLICEGPTDTGAALDLGFDSVGRPNCNSCKGMTAEYCKGRDVVIVADSDRAGISGARKLAQAHILVCPLVKIIIPPESFKDLRQWKAGGLSRDELSGVIDGTKKMDLQIYKELKKK